LKTLADHEQVEDTFLASPCTLHLVCDCMYRPKLAPSKPKVLPVTPENAIQTAIEGDIDKCTEFIELYPELLNRKCERGNTMMHVACSRGDRVLAEMLIRHGADIEVQDMFGNTPLLYAVDKDRVEIVKMLLKRGASVHACDFRGNTPLHSACAVNNLEMVEILLDRGADPEAMDYANQKPANRTSNRAIEQSIERAIQNIKDGGESQTQKIVNYMTFGIGLGVGLGMAMAKQTEMYAQQAREEEARIKESADAKRQEMNARLKRSKDEKPKERRLL
jgi:hypothetical protein